MIDVSEGLVTASCPRCDLLFAVDMKTTLTDAEREAVEFAVEHLQNSGWGIATLRNLLERLK